MTTEKKKRIQTAKNNRDIEAVYNAIEPKTARVFASIYNDLGASEAIDYLRKICSDRTPEQMNDIFFSPNNIDDSLPEVQGMAIRLMKHFRLSRVECHVDTDQDLVYYGFDDVRRDAEIADRVICGLEAKNAGVVNYDEVMAVVWKMSDLLGNIAHHSQKVGAINIESHKLGESHKMYCLLDLLELTRSYHELKAWVPAYHELKTWPTDTR